MPAHCGPGSLAVADLLVAKSPIVLHWRHTPGPLEVFGLATSRAPPKTVRRAGRERDSWNFAGSERLIVTALIEVDLNGCF